MTLLWFIRVSQGIVACVRVGGRETLLELSELEASRIFGIRDNA